MRYKVITSVKEANFTIREEELDKLAKVLSSGSIGIFKEGWLNPSYFAGLVVDRERNTEIRQAQREGRELKEPSPFANFVLENGSIKKLNK